MTETTLLEEDVYEALEEVIDPELGLDFVSLGLVYDVTIEGSEVFITFTLTTPACPIGPQVTEQMREFVGGLDVGREQLRVQRALLTFLSFVLARASAAALPEKAVQSLLAALLQLLVCVLLCCVAVLIIVPLPSSFFS